MTRRLLVRFVRTAALALACAGFAAAVAAEEEEEVVAALDIYGFAMADAIYDFDRVDPAWVATLRPSRIPVVCPPAATPDAGCGLDGEFLISVRQSRLGFSGVAPTPAGDVRAVFEFDLFGVGADEGQTTMRVRHAYGSFRQFLAGQTNSLFMDGDVFPNTIDYWGPAGMVFFRNPQVRWTPIETPELKIAVAIESPGTALDAGNIDTTALGGGFVQHNQYPDFTAQARWDQDWGHLQLGAIVRVLGFEVPANPGSVPNGEEVGGAVNLSGSLKLFESDKILWQVVGGSGFAFYMNDGGTDLAPNAALNGAEVVDGLGWLLYYNRTWNDAFTSSIGFSEHRQWNAGGQATNAFQVGQYGNVNLLYHPTPDMFVGPEFIFGRRVNLNGDDNTDKRLQLSFMYKFGGTVFERRR